MTMYDPLPKLTFRERLGDLISGGAISKRDQWLRVTHDALSAERIEAAAYREMHHEHREALNRIRTIVRGIDA